MYITRQGSSMIHSASTTIVLIGNIYFYMKIFCWFLLIFDGRTNHFWQSLCVGRVDQWFQKVPIAADIAWIVRRLMRHFWRWLRYQLRHVLMWEFVWNTIFKAIFTFSLWSTWTALSDHTFLLHIHFPTFKTT